MDGWFIQLGWGGGASGEGALGANFNIDIRIYRKIQKKSLPLKKLLSSYKGGLQRGNCIPKIYDQSLINISKANCNNSKRIIDHNPALGTQN